MLWFTSQLALEPDLHLCCHFTTCRLLGKDRIQLARSVTSCTQTQARCVPWDNVKCTKPQQIFAKEHRGVFTLQRTINALLKSLDTPDLV